VWSQQGVEKGHGAEDATQRDTYENNTLLEQEIYQEEADVSHKY
jgi:hypothetical protein